VVQNVKGLCPELQIQSFPKRNPLEQRHVEVPEPRPCKPAARHVTKGARGRKEEGAGINKATKYVASNTLTKHEWSHSVFLNGNVVDKIKELKGQDGPELQVHGSGNFIQTLLEHDLVDEFWLKIFPVTLGMGKRLFAQGTIPASYTLVDSKTSPTGVIIAALKRAGEVKTGSF